MARRSAASALAALTLLAAGCGSVIPGTPMEESGPAESVAQVTARPETLLLNSADVQAVYPGGQTAVTNYFNFDTWGPFWTDSESAPSHGCVLPRPISPAPAPNNLVSADIRNREKPQAGSLAMLAIDTGQVDARWPLQKMANYATRCSNYQTRLSGSEIVMAPRARTLSIAGAEQSLLVTLDFHDAGRADRGSQRWVRAYAVVKKVLVVVMVPKTSADSPSKPEDAAVALLTQQVAKAGRLVG